jgi:hypothetical protein
MEVDLKPFCKLGLKMIYMTPITNMTTVRFQLGYTLHNIIRLHFLVLIWRRQNV